MTKAETDEKELLELDPAQWGFPADAKFYKLPEVTEGERALYTRSKWPAGPWHKEPMDQIVWNDPETGFNCIIWRSFMGSWCGYVGVAEKHPAFGKDYNSVDVNVHGGLTFGNYRDRFELALWWLGFDCNHYMDLAPGMLSLERHMLAKDNDTSLWTRHKEYDPETGAIDRGSELTEERYRDVPYVRAEVESLAKQLKEIQDGAS